MVAAALLFGVLAGTCCRFACNIKSMGKWDDALDIFAVHAVGGLVGNILTGAFAQSSVAEFDGATKIPGGWLDHHWAQMGIQLANSMAGMAYTFVVTTVILWAMHFFPGKRLLLRCSDNTEEIGMDDGEMGEFAYDFRVIDHNMEAGGVRRRQQREADSPTTGENVVNEKSPVQVRNGDEGGNDA